MLSWSLLVSQRLLSLVGLAVLFALLAACPVSGLRLLALSAAVALGLAILRRLLAALLGLVAIATVLLGLPAASLSALLIAV